MKRDDTVYLQHIVDAINKINQYLTGIEEEEFSQQSLIQDGVIRQLEVIGEAAKQLSLELRQKNDTIPWRDITGMRDKLIHHYFGVDLEAVWLTAIEDIPYFKKNIIGILKTYQNLKPKT